MVAGRQKYLINKYAIKAAQIKIPGIAMRDILFTLSIASR